MHIIPFSDKHIWSYFHIVLSVPICIIAANGAPVSESDKKVSVHHKTTSVV